MVTFERRVGRLVEVRIVGEIDFRHSSLIALANELGPDAKIVVCADVRNASVPKLELVTRIATAQLASRERIALRVALIGEGPVWAPIADRISEGSASVTELVRTPEDAIARLATVLNTAELARARQFLERAPARVTRE